MLSISMSDVYIGRTLLNFSELARIYHVNNKTICLLDAAQHCTTFYMSVCIYYWGLMSPLQCFIGPVLLNVCNLPKSSLCMCKLLLDEAPTDLWLGSGLIVIQAATQM